MSKRLMKKCGYKTRFRDKDSAIRAMRSIQKRSTREVTPCRPYPCGHCRGYHLTSQPQEGSPQWFEYVATSC